MHHQKNVELKISSNFSKKKKKIKVKKYKSTGNHEIGSAIMFFLYENEYKIKKQISNFTLYSKNGLFYPFPRQRRLTWN